MAKLYFKYGAMGSSKTAQALMCKFNYEQVGHTVLLLKPEIDTRDKSGNKIIVKSRIGLSADCITFDKSTNLYKLIFSLNQFRENSVVIVDECQFCTKEQINELKEVSIHIPVLCYGLLTNFKTELFEGSKRLVEISDSMMEIKMVCTCGKKATINARFVDNKLATDGDEIVVGGNETYKAICYHCYTALKRDLDNKDTEEEDKKEDEETTTA
ncbi:MAG: thymidine kinase [Clostridiales bacterium]|nr:thymidine kinase [Clostridiales bacterium]